MSIAPTPTDPYQTLGVAKDADLETIKKAHRKLVLKHHPDRFTDPAQQAAHRDDFEQAQQAYELLADPQRRLRHDNEVKLNELRKERMAAEQHSRAPPPTYTRTTYTTRPSPGAVPTVRTETTRPEPRSEGRFNYEERAPESYFDTRDFRDQYDEPRTATRKSDIHDRKGASSKVSEKKERTKVSSWEKAFTAAKVASALHQTTKTTKEKTKADRARDAKVRDTRERQDRSEKQSASRYTARVDEIYESDSDTVVATGRRSNVKDSKSSPKSKTRKQPSPEPTCKAPSRSSADPPRFSVDDDDYDDDKHERQHRASRDYIATSQQRPALVRTGSDAYTYWRGDMDDQKISSSPEKNFQGYSRPVNPRRTATDESRRPAMPTANSAPNGLKPQYVNVSPTEPPRSRDLPDRAKPDLKRYGSDPVPKISRKDSAPPQGSKLKHSETNHDSGYGSSSSQQHSPPLRSESPPRRESGRREAPSRETSTKYSIDPSDDRIPRVSRQFLNEEPSRRYLSPEDSMRGRGNPGEDRRERRASRSPRRTRGESESRGKTTKTSRTPTERRPSLNQEGSVRETARGLKLGEHRKLFAELSPVGLRGTDNGSSRRYEPSTVKTASYGSPKYASHAPTSYRTDRVPVGSRRSSATAY